MGVIVLPIGNGDTSCLTGNGWTVSVMVYYWINVMMMIIIIIITTTKIIRYGLYIATYWQCVSVVANIYKMSGTHAKPEETSQTFNWRAVSTTNVYSKMKTTTMS